MNKTRHPHNTLKPMGPIFSFFLLLSPHPRRIKMKVKA
jgi:hypothetical protein